ncbi:MAG TPA: response regulator transcription factor [Candidatus Acidoferrales bacterium]|nr:response regulator transcription factor [Candidatus Acidoferrales bacterium]
MPVRILLVDDHEVIRQGVRSIFRDSRPAWEICGEAATGEEAIQAAKALAPDVVLLDITMPVMGGLEAAPHLIKLGYQVLIFTMHESETLSDEIRKAGIHGYVQKSQATRDLIFAIESVLDGGTFFGREAKLEGKQDTGLKRGPFLRTAFGFC